MNNKKCKELRKICRLRAKDMQNSSFEMKNGQIVLSGYRRLYQDAKKEYKSEKIRCN